MNVAVFILIVTLISFATGFFVAGIISLIKWTILAGESKESVKSTAVKLFSGLFKNKSGQNEMLLLSSNNDSMNKELYQFYHGKN